MTFKENNRKIHIITITCMKMKSFILKYASKIMFYDVNIACYQGSKAIVLQTRLKDSRSRN